MLDNTMVHSLLHLPYQNSHANMMPGFVVDTCQMNIEVLDPSITHSAIINNMYFPSWESTLLPVPLSTALETFNKLYQITETIYHYLYATSLIQWIPLSVNLLDDVMANIYRWHFNWYLKIVVFFPGGPMDTEPPLCQTNAWHWAINWTNDNPIYRCLYVLLVLVELNGCDYVTPVSSFTGMYNFTPSIFSNNH